MIVSNKNWNKLQIPVFKDSRIVDSWVFGHLWSWLKLFFLKQREAWKGVLSDKKTSSPTLRLIYQEGKITVVEHKGWHFQKVHLMGLVPLVKPR